MNEIEIRQKMQGVVEVLLNDISSIRTGRASAGMVSEIVVSVYGGQQRLRVVELGNISVADSQMIVIEPWDKSIIGDIRKGIQAANVGINPSVDGELIRIVVPSMTTEDREKFVKLLHTKLEAARVAVRQIRAEAMKDVDSRKKDKELSEDQAKMEEKKIQELTDEFVGNINEMGEGKEKELMEV